tara:strand:+ start:361 stop:1113 length:753 start_codon:yes stop_codon:yes gene_type:complete
MVPFLTGFIVAFTSRGRGMLAIMLLTSLLCSVLFLISGWEAILCILVTFPIVMIAMGAGAFFGYRIAKKFIHRYGNHMVVLISLSLITLVGWTDREDREPRPLEVRTSMKFYAPMKEVWNVVRESGQIDGNDSFLKFIGLPVPRNCVLLPDNQRVCHFDEGSILQEITEENYGKNIELKIIDSFEVREWLDLDSAGYRFVQRSDHVEVIRTDLIRSILRPRWYWHWFEEKCIGIEHRYVMSSMKRKVEIK